MLIMTRLGSRDLYKPKKVEEGLDAIFGDRLKIEEDQDKDQHKLQEIVAEYKRDPAIRVTTKYKIGKPLI